MGSGKTEAALACAEIFADKTDGQVCFRLPTQATSDGVRPCNRLDRHVGDRRSTHYRISPWQGPIQ